MNTVTLNGVSSSTISGLLIQKLPVVKKPAVRFKKEEIDGRDGDSIIKLGYAAYDRELLIGLHGSYSEDNVIKFFNSSGNAVFSNEPDKLYNYEILNEMELEKLLSFRQAVVNFHVQPFKHKVNETLLTGTNSVTVVNTGNIYAKPTVKITGSGNISLYIGSTQIFQIALGDEGYITLNGEEMEARKGAVLKNRLVTGNYDNFILPVGESTISATGTVTGLEVSNYNRWI